MELKEGGIDRKGDSGVGGGWNWREGWSKRVGLEG